MPWNAWESTKKHFVSLKPRPDKGQRSSAENTRMKSDIYCSCVLIFFDYHSDSGGASRLIPAIVYVCGQ